MAKSAVARLGAVKRGMIERRRKTGAISDAISSVGTIATFAAGQAKRAETAWGEYETGYKELGGKDFERPKFGKGYFKGPEGEVRIGERMYDREKIQEAGSFLGGESGAMMLALDETGDIRTKYLESIVPGREAPKLQQPTNVPVSTPSVSGVGRTEPIQESEYGGVDPKPRGPNLGSMWSQFQRGPWAKFKGHVSEGLNRLEQKQYDKRIAEAGAGGRAMFKEKYPELYTDEQRQPYMEPRKSSWDASLLSRNKHDSGGGETGWLDWIGQDQDEYNGR